MVAYILTRQRNSNIDGFEKSWTQNVSHRFLAVLGVFVWTKRWNANRTARFHRFCVMHMIPHLIASYRLFWPKPFFGAKRSINFHATELFTLFNRQSSSLRPTVDIKEPNNPVHGISFHSSRLFSGCFFDTELIGSTKLWAAGLVTLDFQISW